MTRTTYRTSFERRISKMDANIFIVLMLHRWTEVNPVTQRRQRKLWRRAFHLLETTLTMEECISRPSKYSMSLSMYQGGARGYGRPSTVPPDLPSLFLNTRIIYLGMPVVPAVAEVLVPQFMWLDYDNSSELMSLYINSPGKQVNTISVVFTIYQITKSLSFMLYNN
ncbi:ATP-dependent Clp protease proteolytic subunit-related protein 1, chloroplastic-like [Typha latifolia]|uniref:ATP-dependent Clp protease proteolytic subunit-related protein 1, chloroplastic-like n=1 Tax=Typha latifolia TaxID=4733 RepID=UPI003C2E828D